MKRLAGLHVIMDCSRAIELARIAQEEGAAIVQLRDKVASDEGFLGTAHTLRAILDETTFIVNDRADIAAAVSADGVHLGQTDMAIEEARHMLGQDTFIGISTSTVSEAVRAEQQGANYVGFGHMFTTRSKQKPSAPQTVSELKTVVNSVSIPVIAIGGITESNASQILVSGLGGIAVISAISDSRMPRATTRNFIRMLKEYHAAYV